MKRKKNDYVPYRHTKQCARFSVFTVLYNMDSESVLEKMRHITDSSKLLFQKGGNGMPNWKLAWGTAKRCPVSVSSWKRHIIVSKHFIPLIEAEQIVNMIAVRVFELTGTVTRWPLQIDCIKHFSEQNLVKKRVHHSCKCGLYSKTSHCVDKTFAAQECPQCRWQPDVFRDAPHALTQDTNP